MPQVVAQLIELIEDDRLGARRADLGDLVVDLLDVALRAGCGDDLARYGPEPVESLLAHPLGEDGDGLAAQELGVVGSSAAIISGGGPYGLVARRVELPRHEARDEAAETRPHLMGPRGEPLAAESKNPCPNPGYLTRDLEVIDLAVEPAALLGLILPGDSEEVCGIDVPKPGLFQFFLDAGGSVPLGIPHLLERRDQDITFFRQLHRIF